MDSSLLIQVLCCSAWRDGDVAVHSHHLSRHWTLLTHPWPYQSAPQLCPNSAFPLWPASSSLRQTPTLRHLLRHAPLEADLSARQPAGTAVAFHPPHQMDVADVEAAITNVQESLFTVHRLE
jgi:hypothetical protein